jgi:uncharacterized membrane protein
MSATDQATTETTRSLMRVELFSDAVFAIAMTLLVVELKVPQVDDPRKLTSALWAQYPIYLAFFISFFIVAIQWVDHHSMFSHIERCTPGLVWRNLAFLFCVVFLPFPTALLGNFPRQRVVLVLYATTVGVSIMAKIVLWRYATQKRNLTKDGLSDAYTKKVTTTEIYLLACVFVLFIMACLWPQIAAYGWIAFGGTVFVVKIRSSVE